MPAQALGHMLDDGAHLRAARGARRTQDRRHRRAARHVIDVHRRKATLVVMRNYRTQAVETAMRCAERVVDVENRLLARPHRRAGLVDQRGGEPRCLCLARRILQTADRRLRGSAAPRLSDSGPTAIFISGSCRSRSRSIASSWPHAIAATRAITISNISCSMRLASRTIRHRSHKPRAHPKPALRLSQQQQTTIRRVIAAVKINCEFLASDRWKVKRKRCSVLMMAVALG